MLANHYLACYLGVNTTWSLDEIVKYSIIIFLLMPTEVNANTRLNVTEVFDEMNRRNIWQQNGYGLTITIVLTQRLAAYRPGSYWRQHKFSTNSCYLKCGDYKIYATCYTNAASGR